MDFLLDGEESRRLLFRKLAPSDFGSWLPFHQDKRTSEFWSGLPEDPKAACEEDIKRTLYRYENDLGGRMAIVRKDTNELVGLAGLLIQEVDDQREVEIAYSLLPRFWKQGFATEAAQKSKAYAFTHELADSLISIIHIHNTPSQKVALNNGMVLEKTTTYKNNPVHIYRTPA